jgi:hypothetical protein
MRARTVSALLVQAVVLIGGCAAAASPATSASSPTDATPPSPSPSAAVSASPTPDPRSALGPAPTVEYPEAQALGTFTIALTSPAVEASRGWLVCEWPDTSGVRYLYIRDARLLGERIFPSITLDADAPGFSFSRDGALALYSPNDATTFEATRAPDGTSGTIAFHRLPLNPDSWEPGPLPTPAASFERPLGGRTDAAVLDGTVSWQCDPAPAGLPTPAPPEPPTPSPDGPLVRIPNATLHAGEEAAIGVPGCGVTYTIDGEFAGGDSCGPSYQLIDEEHAIRAVAGKPLTLTLPSGMHVTAWSMAWIDQPTAEHWRGAQPPDMHRVEGATGSIAPASRSPGCDPATGAS